MFFIKKLWIVINIIIIILILIRSPNEQSVQEIIGPLDLFESSRDTKKNMDKLIAFFTFLYFSCGLLMNVKNLLIFQ